MTREEAIKNLEALLLRADSTDAYGDMEDMTPYEDAVDMAIQALEQEPCDVFDKYGNYKYPSDVELTEPNTATSMPCEDTISRQAVLDIDFKRIILTTAKPAEMIEQKVKSLPSVTPQLKTEKVIKMRDATPEERESIAKYIKSISKPTAIEFDEEQEQLDFVQPHKEPRQDLQQAAERIIKQQNKWFEEQERKEQEPAYCDRNICLRNEYNGIGCEECEVIFYQGKSIREWIKIIAEQEKGSGTWIGIDEEPHEVWECDHCGFVIDGSGCIDPYDYLDTYKFCPNCGARMD